jgi:hypothetical protein
MNEKGEQKRGEGQWKGKRQKRWIKEEIGGKIAGEITRVEEQGRKRVEGSGKSKGNKMTEEIKKGKSHRNDEGRVNKKKRSREIIREKTQMQEKKKEVRG